LKPLREPAQASPFHTSPTLKDSEAIGNWLADANKRLADVLVDRSDAGPSGGVELGRSEIPEETRAEEVTSAGRLRPGEANDLPKVDTKDLLQSRGLLVDEAWDSQNSENSGFENSGSASEASVRKEVERPPSRGPQESPAEQAKASNQLPPPRNMKATETSRPPSAKELLRAPGLLLEEAWDDASDEDSPVASGSKQAERAVERIEDSSVSRSLNRDGPDATNNSLSYDEDFEASEDAMSLSGS